MNNPERLKQAAKLLWEVVAEWDEDALISYPVELPSLDELAAAIGAIELRDDPSTE